MMDILEMIESRKAQTETKRERMRREFPLTAEAVDQLRELFGEVKVLWLSENGREVGKQTWSES